ncbi:MAG: ATP-binding cassette domain-containing protein, partial [Pseudomonadota bacterium]
SYTGTFNRSERLSVSYLPQEPPWQRGWLGEHLRAAGLEEGPFRQALAALGMRGADAERPLETLSFGQRKKIALARSLLEPSSLLLWDEPLNYLDIDAREALETLISTAQPTMILIEHDAAFVDAVATATVTLVPQAPARS